jgi:hypothetical protein
VEQQIPAGWYPDPDDSGRSQRYWDGDDWTERTRSANRSRPAPMAQVLEDDKPDASGFSTSLLARRPVLGVVLAIVAVLLIAGGIRALAGSGGRMVTVGLTLTDSGFTNGSSCEGTGGYSDLQDGTSVVLTNENNKILATTQLGEGMAASATECVWSVDIDNVPKAKFYSVEVASRGKITMSAEDLSTASNSFSLTLGS